MKTVPITHAGMQVPTLGLGLMRAAEMSADAIRDLVRTGRDLGIDFIDTADVYGPSLHEAERRLGEALALTSAQRSELTIQTKAGIVRGGHGTYFDFSYEHLVESVDGSLRALGTDYIDILLLHRPDALVEPDEVARAFDALQSSGKVRHFGVSNHTPGQIALLMSSLDQPLVANQVQLSLHHAGLVTQGLVANIGHLEQSLSRDLGLLDYCRRHGIAIQAWGPFRSSIGRQSFVGDTENCAELNELLEELAETYGVTPNGIATAWLTRHPAQIQVILGTTRPSRVADAAVGAEVELTRSDWYRLLAAAGHTIP